MFPSSSLLSLLLLAVSTVNATPVERRSNTVTLGFAAKINAIGAKTIPEIDRAHAKYLVESAKSKTSRKRAAITSTGVSNNGVSYLATVNVGLPPTQYNLLIDTGSSNTWIGADTMKPYHPTSTSQSTGNKVSVAYGSGSFSGTEYIDTVDISSGLLGLGNGLSITKQSIGVASTSSGFDNVDGILGVGPTDLTKGTVANTGLVPTVVDNLFSEGKIPSAVLGIFYAPAEGLDLLANGELTFGGVDTKKITGSVSYVPLTTTNPASEYWGIDQSVSYGTTAILASTAGIVDTGTTLVLLATGAFTKYKAVTGGVMDSTTGLLKITQAQYSALKPLNFKVGSKTYPLTPNAQIFPRSLNTQIGGSASDIYLIVSDLGSNVGEGLDFINGYAFLERFYSVFDTTKQRVGFATTAHTTATTN